MAWDKRGYYYRKRRRGKQVISIYLGRDSAAKALACMDMEARQEAASCRTNLEAEHKKYQALDKPLIAYNNGVSAVFERTLKAAGYYKHKRSEWRKRRNIHGDHIMPKSAKSIIKPGVDSGLETNPSKAVTDKLINESHSDKTSCQQLMDVFEAFGATRELAQLYDQAALAKMALINATHPDDLLAQQASRKHLELMKRELAGPNPTPLECLLADRIALCWAHVNFYERIILQNSTEMTIPTGDYFRKSLDQAHKRFLSATRELSLLRKMQPALVQVNIGQNQVNMAQGDVAQVNVTAASDDNGRDNVNGRVWESTCVAQTTEVLTEGN